MISILIPVYNEENYIDKCLHSIILQNNIDLEICISDNASTDNTWKKLVSWQKNDKRIKLFRQKLSVHPHDNLKKTLEMSSGQHLYIIGGDDFIAPNSLGEALNQHCNMSNYIGTVLTMSYFSDKDGVIKELLPPRELLAGLNGPREDLLKFILRHMNHDELLLGIYQRDKLTSSFNLMKKNTLEPLGMILVIAIIFSNKYTDNRINFTNNMILMKRYDKQMGANSNATMSEKVFNPAPLNSLFIEHCYKCIGSIFIGLSFYKNKFFTIKELFIWLFAPRYHQGNSFFSAGPVLSPFCKIVTFVNRKLVALHNLIKN